MFIPLRTSSKVRDFPAGNSSINAFHYTKMKSNDLAQRKQALSIMYTQNFVQNLVHNCVRFSSNSL